MASQFPIKRRKIETVFLGAIGQIDDVTAINKKSADSIIEANLNTPSTSFASLNNDGLTTITTTTVATVATTTTTIQRHDLSINQASNCNSNGIKESDYHRTMDSIIIEQSMDSDIFNGITKSKSTTETEMDVIPEITDSTRIVLRPLLLETKKKEPITVLIEPTIKIPSKGEIIVQLKQRTDCIITSVVAVNQCPMNSSINRSSLLKCGKIFGRNESVNNCWEIFVKSNIVLLHANHNWTVASCENCDLIIISTRTGKMHQILRTDYSIANLLLHENICLAILSNADVFTWNLNTVNVIVHKSLECLLRMPDSKILNYGVSETGIPMILMDNEECVVYSKRVNSWINVNAGIVPLSIFIAPIKFIASIVPNGLIALLTNYKSCTKEKWDLNPETNAICEENQLEALLEACRVLDSCIEFRFIFNIYVQKLMAREKYEKLTEILVEFKRTLDETNFATLLEDIEPILAENHTSFEKLLAENNESIINLSFID